LGKWRPRKKLIKCEEKTWKLWLQISTKKMEWKNGCDKVSGEEKRCENYKWADCGEKKLSKKIKKTKM
jgi:hypothetical protein